MTASYMRALWRRQAEDFERRRLAGIELPAFAYDIICASAEKYGGIGYGLFTEEINGIDVPLDPCGMLAAVLGSYAEALSILRPLGLCSHEAEIVYPQRIIARLGIPDGPHDPAPRFPFEEWRRELNVSRKRAEAKPPHESLAATREAVELAGVGPAVSNNNAAQGGVQ